MPTHTDDTLRAIDRAHQLAAAFLANLDSRPVSGVPTADVMLAALDEPLPEHGSDPAEAVAEWMRRAEPGITASPGPRFFGFVTGGVTPAALAGDWLASTIDQNAGLWAASPAASTTEQVVLRWLRELFRLPMEWSGALTSGATMANLVGLGAGRQWVGERLGFDPSADGLGGRPPIRVISSEEIHSSAVKALGTLGLGRDAVIRLPSPNGSVDLDALERALAQLDEPVIVVANAGEVNGGGFDDIAGVAERCAAHGPGSWLHVDGAFGLFAALSERTAPLLAGIERADSVAADAHKWLNVPYDSGFAFVRDEAALRAAFRTGGAYLTAAPGSGWDPFTHVPEMSRRFRGLPAWCALRAWGRDGYRAMVDRCLDNTRDFAAWVEETPGLELVSDAHLNIACFRLAGSGPGPERDALNRAAVSAIQADGRVFVTGTTWRGGAAIRAAFDNWLTTTDDVALLKQAVLDAQRQLA